MKIRSLISSLAILAALLCSCTRGEMGYSFTDKSEETGKVLIFYASGSSNLARYIRTNIDTIRSGSLPYRTSRKTVFIFAHLDSGETCLQKLFFDEYNNPTYDTLLTVAAGRSASDPGVIAEVLGKVLEVCPPENNSYTLILSSHGTGWLPSGARNKSTESDFVSSFHTPRRVYGSEFVNGVVVDISIQDLADAIPMKLDCLVFDACLMGGIEVAYQLRNKVVKLCCSPAEVPGNGYIYTEMADELLSDSSSPERFSKAYFEHYRTALEILLKTGHHVEDSDYGATSTTVDCTKLEPLAEVCATLFEKYRAEIAAVDPDNVQHFYRVWSDVDYYRDFYDMEDILVKAGMSEEDHRQLKQALDGCITYKAATQYFMKYYGGFDIATYCGLSMYLPSRGDASLNAFYKTLDWNIATKLVE